VLCCSSGSFANCSGDSARAVGSKDGAHTGTSASSISSAERVPAQLAICSGVPAYSAASNSVSANRKGRVRVSICTTNSGCASASAGKRGISQRPAKVGTAASAMDRADP